MKEKSLQIDENTLIDILADGSTPFPTNSSSSDFLVFVNHFNLEKGRHLVSTNMLYSLYNMWAKSPISQKAFKDQLGNNFITQKGKVLLNVDNLKIDKHTYTYINNSMQNAKSATQKKHLNAFFKKYDIKKGNVWLPFPVFYYLYGVWIYSLNKKNGLGMATLKNMFQILLPCKVKNKVMHFGVSALIYNHITQEQIEEIIQNKRQAPQSKAKSKVQK